MTSERRDQGKRKQERACAQAFLNWLSSQRHIQYDLQRADECPALKGHWDFVAWAKGDSRWIAIEVKAPDIAQWNRQFGDWDKFCRLVTEELRMRRTVTGSFVIVANVPWAFDQKQGKLLVNAAVEALVQVALNIPLDEMVDLGPEIKGRFDQWPTEPPTIDHALLLERHECVFIHRPKALWVHKSCASGRSVELISMGQPCPIDPALTKAILGIFDHKPGKTAKPNEQLGEAKQKGASETILLLDSNIEPGANVFAQVLENTDRNLLSNIDAVFLVSVGRNHIEKVWPSE